MGIVLGPGIIEPLLCVCPCIDVMMPSCYCVDMQECGTFFGNATSLLDYLCVCVVENFVTEHGWLGGCNGFVALEHAQIHWFCTQVYYRCTGQSM